MDELIQGLLNKKIFFIGENLNGDIGNDNGDFQRVHVREME